MKHAPYFLLGSLAAFFVSISILVGCRDIQETNPIVPEPQETIIVTTEKPERSVAKSNSEVVREIPDEKISPKSSGGIGDDQATNTTPAMHDRQIMLGARFEVTVPNHWIIKPPTVSLLEHEFTVPSTEKSQPDGRVTLMAARGGINANVERWVKQFRLTDGRDENQAIVREQRTIAGQKVHLVDISGTYLEPLGPMMEQIVEREGYRMLGAIIECQDGFLYFIKFYGPEKTVAENKADFITMIESLRTLDSR